MYRGAYRGISYIIAGALVLVPFMFLIAFIFSMTSWWAINISVRLDLFLFDLFGVFMILYTGSNAAQLISVLVSDAMAGQVIGTGIFAIMFLCSGFFIPGNQIPLYLIWLYNISLFHWCFDPLFINGLSHTSYNNITSNDILERYGLQNQSKWLGIGILILFNLLFRIGFYYRLITKYSGLRH